MNRQRQWLAAMAMVLAMLAAGTGWAEPTSWYVVTNTVSESDGTSWAKAYTNVQDALDNVDVTPGVTNIIHLAGHTFNLATNVNWASQTNVIVRGGYEGLSGTPGTNNPVLWPTILRQTGSNQRVILVNTVTNCSLEQVTLTGGTVGTADLDGAGMRIVNSDLDISDCVISNNVTSTGRDNRNGGGIHVVGGTVQFLRCRIEHNRLFVSDAYQKYLTGGGIYVNGGSTVIRHSRIAGNILETDRSTDSGVYIYSARGGGIYLADGSLLVENSSIVSNICGRMNAYINAYAAGVGHASGSALTLRNCLIAHNANLSKNQLQSRYGAGVVLETGGVIENCTIAGNQMYNATNSGAGLRVDGGSVSNTIVYANWRGLQQQDFGGNAANVFYSCAPELTDGENNNITDAPRFINAATGDFRLDFGSPCIDTGNDAGWMTTATDLDGNDRILQGRPDRSETVDRGAYETEPLAQEGSLVGDFAADPVVGIDEIDVVFTAYAGGANTNDLHYYWDFANSGDFDLDGADKRTVTNTYGPGMHSVRLVVSNQNDETHQVIKTNHIHVSSSIAYVSTTGDNTSGANWDGAFTSLQTALDQSGVTEIRIAGGEYLLTEFINWSDHDGVTIRGGYQGTGNPGEHDPEQWPTILRQTGSGQRVILMNAVTNCSLEQVTLTGGTVGTDDLDGAGMRIVNSDLDISDCVISNNVTSTGRDHRNGGGIHVVGGTVQFLRCRIEHNRLFVSDAYQRYLTGGGIYVNGGSTVIRHSRIAGNILETDRSTDSGANIYSARGGGIYLAGGSLLVENSSIVSNICGRTNAYINAYAAGAGHAADSALTLRNCLIAQNANLSKNQDQSRYGAGAVLASGGVIENCTIAGNQMYSPTDAGAGLRVDGGAVTNTIVWGNLRDTVTNDVGFGTGVSEAANVFYSLASELTETESPNNNRSANPLFVDAPEGDFHLQNGSPAIDAGTFQSWMTGAVDLDGLPRVKGTVDMGCYETQPPSGTVIMLR